MLDPLETLSPLFTTAFAGSRNPMLVVDEHRVLVEVNAAFLAVFGRRRDALVGAPIHELVADGPLFTPDEWARMLAAEHFAGEADLLRADGRRVAVEWAAARETTAEGCLVLFVALGAAEPGSQTDTAGHPRDADEELTAREREVVALVAHGHSNQEIAAELHVSPETVKSHMSNVMRKLHARSRAHVVAKAFTSGLVFG